MSKIVEGFYEINKKIYYGEYNEEQKNGGIYLIYADKESFMTEHPFEKDEIAVGFWDNHTLFEPELLLLKNGLAKLSTVFGNSSLDFEGIDFVETERRLNITMPDEMKYLYAFLDKNPYLTEGKERFLTLSEIYIDEGNLVFYKSKRTPTGISLDTRVLMTYYKKEWLYQNYGASILMFIFQYISADSVIKMPNKTKAVLRGRIKSYFPEQLKEEFSKAFGDSLKILEEYENDSHFILYHENGSAAWFRSNGMYADLLIGSQSAKEFEKLTSAVPEDWKPIWKEI